MLEEKLIQIIRSVLDLSEPVPLDPAMDWGKLVALAKRNGIFQYLYRYAKQLSEESRPSGEIASRMEVMNGAEIRSGILQEYTVDTLRQGLEEKGIDHMLIKGSVTKGRYPDPYLRSMGDIDFLYRVEQHNDLCRAMADLGFAVKSIGRVHDLYVSDSHVVVEAHRQLMSSNSAYYAFCEDIWGRVEKKEGAQHEYAMRLEDEFIFNFIHLASHFKKGGVGIRFVVDVWIYKQLVMDWTYIHDTLSSLNLDQFYHAIDRLSDKWFGQEAVNDDLVDEIEGYIFNGGIFGNSEHRNNAAVRNGKIRYFFRACFPSYAEMQSMFPSLKHKALLPIAWIRRGIDSLIRRRKNIKTLLEPMKNSDTDSAAEMKRFYVRCGLE